MINNLPIDTTNLDGTFDMLASNRAHKMPSFLPSIRINSDKARKLLFNKVDLNQTSAKIPMTQSNFNVNKSMNEKHNMSVMVSKGVSLRSPIPTRRSLRIGSREMHDLNMRLADMYRVRGEIFKERFRR